MSTWSQSVKTSAGERPAGERPHEIARALTLQAEAMAFWRMRARILRRTGRQAIATSRLRVSLVVFLSLFFWAGLFVLFSQGFRFLNSAIGHAGTHALTVQAIYNVFFASLMAMLIVSSGIILYSGLYCSSEAAFLLTLPIRPERIVQHKFQEAIAFSSWGFLLLGTPMLVAYGVEADSPWYYFVLLFPFMFTFIYIPGGIGAILCLVLVHRLPRMKMPWLAGLSLLGVCGLLLVGWRLLTGTENNILTNLWFQEMLARLQFSEHRMLPSWWLSSGLLQAAHSGPYSIDNQPWAQSLLFLSLLVSNALACHLVTMWIASKLYRSGYSGLHTQRTARRRRGQFWLDKLVLRAMPFLSPQLRFLIVKDLKVFRRDPVQWSQFLIFFGLLTLYFVNIRRFSYDINYTGWVNMISFLNLAVVGLILSTFTTRFIFPLISLEGRRFWILGLLPVERDSILWGKFLFAAAGSLIPCTALILLSDAMLQISWLVVLIHQLICLILCLGLSGIAVGLGAAMPDLREQSPSKIAAGFGGTLNLVISAMYIVVVVLLTALPCHFYLASADTDWESLCQVVLVVGTLSAILIGALATHIPMRIGLAAFREMEM
jgi:ABC-2 type transport system permease protein